MGYTVSNPIWDFIQQTTQAGMLHSTLPFATIDTSNKILTILGGTTGGVSITGSGMGGQNALKITAGSSTDFSALCYFDQASGIEHGAIGWGNQTGGALQNISYWEMSDLSSSTVNNGGMIVQSSAKNGYAWSPRITIGADLSPIVVTAYDGSGNSTVSTFNSFGIQVTGSPGSPHTSNFLVGYDVNTGIQFRSNIWNTGADGNSISYFSYGDTAANFGGHVFSTGGLAGAQTVKMVIGNDIIQFFEPIGSPLYVEDATASYGILGFDANAHINFRSGNDSNNYYSYGGATSEGKGHLFYTGGVMASQSLRLQIADDATSLFAAKIMMPNIPTNDPHVAGQLWNNLGIMTISAG